MNTWIVGKDLMKHINVLKTSFIATYHDLYVQSDPLLLADVFENFRNKCIEIYELDPAHFFIFYPHPG